ncbi:MAG: hypothetical protein ACTSXL_05770 [Alphaproteobacteria bacterium]|nr:MAG: hypothetical protein B6I23_02560 [Rickettsiaceae bacterium 4572_127]
MKKIILGFLLSIPIVSNAINPLMLQQGIGTIMNVKNKVGEMKNATNACRFTESDGTFVYGLMVEYNMELYANDDGAILVGESKPAITKDDDIKSRAIAGQILGQMGNWSTTDYTSDELARINKFRNNSACAGQAVQVLGGMKEQILSPLLGQIAPGMGGMLGGVGGGGLGNLGGMLQGLGGGQ